MPLDYSKFDNVGESDSDDECRNLDFRDLFPKAAADDDGGDDDAGGSPRVSPRAALAARQGVAAAPPPPPRARAEPAEQAEQDDRAASGPPPPLATLERFAALAAGGAEGPARGEDAAELLAVARASAQSAAAAGDPAPRRLLARALLAGLEAAPRPVDFAREQAPELVAELLDAAAQAAATDGGDAAFAEETERLLGLLVARCRKQEVYTFLMEALAGEELAPPARLRGVWLLRSALLAMEASRWPMFLGACLPTLLKRSISPATPSDLLAPYLEALKAFAEAFLPGADPGAEAGAAPSAARITQAMICAFLFKLLPLALPLVAPVAGLELRRADGGQAAAVALQRGPAPPGAALEALCGAARAAAGAAGRPPAALAEELDVGDPTGDGGGDLEISPLCVAAYVCLLETPGCWRALRPQVLPVVFSPARRLNALMRSCFVLVSYREDAPEVISLGEATAAAAPRGPHWAHRGLELFARVAAPALREAAAQTPRALGALAGPLCRWHPRRAFQALLESLAANSDIDMQARGALFRDIRDAMRHFEWPCRYELYRDIVARCRVDSIIGAVVTVFKDDWWPRVAGLDVEVDRAVLLRERDRLVEMLRATLSGDVQVVDGMDTLTAALNIARLVALAAAPAAPTLRAALRRGGPGVDLDGMLAGVSQQIDFELKLLEGPSQGGGASAQCLAEQVVAEALGRADGGVDMQAMKRDRITMVAHLVARVREVLAAADA